MEKIIKKVRFCKGTYFLDAICEIEQEDNILWATPLKKEFMGRLPIGDRTDWTKFGYIID